LVDVPGGPNILRLKLRIVQTELLDSLPPDHPDARLLRRDLRIINALMGNYRWLVRTLSVCAAPGESVLEVGAGTGDLARLLHRRNWRVDGLDTWPTPESWPATARWHRADLRTFTGFDGYDVIYGNMIFHQFTADELAAIGKSFQAPARLILACEPERQEKSQRFFRMVAPLVGASRVSRHDGEVSIAAGFQGDELPHLLALDESRWTWRCHTSALGANRMIAWRRDRPCNPG
jgi:SAM-dependent methyltransferase